MKEKLNVHPVRTDDDPGREKMRSLQGSCKILVEMQLLVRSYKEICSLQDLGRKCFP